MRSAYSRVPAPTNLRSWTGADLSGDGQRGREGFGRSRCIAGQVMRLGAAGQQHAQSEFGPIRLQVLKSERLGVNDGAGEAANRSEKRVFNSGRFEVV